MDKLAKFISEKTGLDEKTSKQVTEAVVDFLKKNLPAPLNANVEKLIAGDIKDLADIGLGGGGGLGGLLSGLFGGKKKK